MPLYRDRAVILRATPLKEADRIITFLTQEHGQVRAVAHGIRKTTSRFGARLDPLNLVDVQLREGRGDLASVSQVETQRAFGAVAVEDYAVWTAGQAMAETAEKLTHADSGSGQFLLLVSGLEALVTGAREPGLALDAYMLRAMAIAGWGATFDECARCGEPGPHRWFSIGGGGAMCADCHVLGCATPAPETLQLLGALLAGDWGTADGSEPRHRNEATGLVNATLQWHLEREVRSLKHVDRKLKGSVRAV